MTGFRREKNPQITGGMENFFLTLAVWGVDAEGGKDEEHHHHGES